MLPLPTFEWLAPRSLAELVAALGDRPEDTALLAGGTDLLPNLKHGLAAPRRVIGLRRIEELATLDDAADGGLDVGAGVTLDRLAQDRRIAARYPALAEAARLVASPQIRRMATLGGNLCLDTRCRYYNQTGFWRGALGHCLKKDGDRCHVVPQGRRCVAAMSADTPAPLIALGATVELVSVRGRRTLPVAALFAGDGVRNHVRAPDEVLVRVHLPPPPLGLRTAYLKLRARQAIDFPLLSIAVAVEVDDHDAVRDLRVVIGALGAVPRILRHLEPAIGQPLSAAVIDQVASAAYDQCRPLANLGVEGWRHDVVAPMLRRALQGLRPTS